MSFRHWTRLQNQSVAEILLRAAQAMGAAALIALLMPGVSPEWNLADLIGVLVIAGLVGLLGFSMLGRVDDPGGVLAGGVQKRRRRGRK